jgi:nucleoside-diphosphate-sugar epimerase
VDKNLSYSLVNEKSRLPKIGKCCPGRININMKVLVTGSAGHLGEALVRTLKDQGYEVLGIDQIDSDFTDEVGTITNQKFVKQCMEGIDTVFHAATLHKPHVATHRRQDFIDTNITGTLNLLEEAVSTGISSFIYTSTTSTFGEALTPYDDNPAAWITEDVIAVPKNICPYLHQSIVL